jgi:hypothetical protein
MVPNPVGIGLVLSTIKAGKRLIYTITLAFWKGFQWQKKKD